MPYDIERMFAYQRPTDDQIPKYEAINNAAKNLALVIVQNVPVCEDQEEAIKYVSMARMIANRGIALEGALTTEKYLLVRLAKVFQSVEIQDFRVEKITVSTTTHNCLRMSRDFDPNNQLIDLKRGFLGFLWGAKVWVSKDLGPNEIVVEPDFSGVPQDVPAVVERAEALRQLCSKVWTF
jgi:ribosome-binding factor A